MQQVQELHGPVKKMKGGTSVRAPKYGAARIEQLSTRDQLTFNSCPPTDPSVSVEEKMTHTHTMERRNVRTSRSEHSHERKRRQVTVWI